MKTFRFPMQKVLEWRTEEREVERAKMRRLGEDLQQVERQMLALSNEIFAVRQRVIDSAVLDANDLSPIPAYEERVKKQLSLLQDQKAALVVMIAEQRQRLLEAQRRVELLQKLKDSRLAAWKKALNAENEAFAAESYLARWGAKRASEDRHRGDGGEGTAII